MTKTAIRAAIQTQIKEAQSVIDEWEPKESDDREAEVIADCYRDFQAILRRLLTLAPL
jgi:hypothetical protein